jgi:transposase
MSGSERGPTCGQEIPQARQRTTTRSIMEIVGLKQLKAAPELKGLAEGLIQDCEAVRAALTHEWSSGQTEGQIDRLKFIKRQMYGRMEEQEYER